MARYDDTARGLAIGYIVAIVICVLFFLVVVPILGCCLYKRRQKRLRARNQASQSAYASRVGPGQQTQTGYHPVPNYGYPQQGQQGQQGQQYYPQGQQQAGVAWPQQQAQQGQQQQYGYYAGEQKPPGY